MLLVYLATALVPSDTACLESSPGRISLTAVWTSRLFRVGRRLYLASLDASDASLSNMSIINELTIPMARVDIFMSGCTSFITLWMKILKDSFLFFTFLAFFFWIGFVVVLLTSGTGVVLVLPADFFPFAGIL